MRTEMFDSRQRARAGAAFRHDAVCHLDSGADAVSGLSGAGRCQPVKLRSAGNYVVLMKTIKRIALFLAGSAALATAADTANKAPGVGYTDKKFYFAAW